VIKIYTIKTNGHAEIIEKRSKFIADVYKVTSQQEAVDIINETKKRESGARHVVYAYVIGSYTKYSDDGEPQGTAGVPILNLIEKMQLSNVLVTVTRYFGGILLGTGGLVRAYTTVAQNGLKMAEKIEIINKTIITLEIPYELKDKISFYIKKQEYEEKEIYYSENIKMSVNIPDKDVEDFTKNILEITEGKVKIEKSLSNDVDKCD